jgi:hypothetical protein
MKIRRLVSLVLLAMIGLGVSLHPQTARADGGGLPTLTPTITRTPTATIPPGSAQLNTDQTTVQATAPLPANVIAPEESAAEQPFVADAAPQSQPTTGNTFPLGPLGAIILVIVIFVVLGLLFFRRQSSQL